MHVKVLKKSLHKTHANYKHQPILVEGEKRKK